jgi:hypothetical protein
VNRVCTDTPSYTSVHTETDGTLYLYSDLNGNETGLLNLASLPLWSTTTRHETFDHGFGDFPADEIHP